MESPRSTRSLPHLMRVKLPARLSSQIDKQGSGVRTWKLLIYVDSRALYLFLRSPSQYLVWTLLLLVLEQPVFGKYSVRPGSRIDLTYSDLGTPPTAIRAGDRASSVNCTHCTLTVLKIFYQVLDYFLSFAVAFSL